jgi:hypothetical protein
MIIKNTEFVEMLPTLKDFPYLVEFYCLDSINDFSKNYNYALLTKCKENDNIDFTFIYPSFSSNVWQNLQDFLDKFCIESFAEPYSPINLIPLLNKEELETWAKETNELTLYNLHIKMLDIFNPYMDYIPIPMCCQNCFRIFYKIEDIVNDFGHIMCRTCEAKYVHEIDYDVEEEEN